MTLSNKPPEHVDKLLHKKAKEPKAQRKEPIMSKPKGIERKGSKFRVFLDIKGKKVHIGYYKTLEEATEALTQAQQESGVYD